MREFGLAILGRAVYDLTFSEMMAPFKHSMAVGLAAQGAEISIKARIAQSTRCCCLTSCRSRRRRRAS